MFSIPYGWQHSEDPMADKEEKPPEVNITTILLGLAVIIGGYLYARSHDTTIVTPHDDDVVVTELTPGEYAAILYVAEYCENMDEAFVLNAARITTEDSIATDFHPALSEDTKKARETAAAADKSIDQTLEAANTGPEPLKARVKEVGGGFRQAAIKLRQLLEE